MRRIVLIATLGALLPLAPARAEGDPVELAVSFEIVNQNRTPTAPLCPGDGKTYTLRGSLVGPAGVETGAVESVTLYVHGSGDASTWHFTALPGLDHITEMARLGHASLFVHSLGYGPSDRVDGTSVCFGTFADHTHQVIEHLRAGSYLAGGAPGPAFERVALAGHSAGGGIAELEALSFHDVDALIISGWTDYPWPVTMADDPPGPFLYSAVAGFARRCATEPESKEPGGPGGWAFLFTTRTEVEILMPNIEPAVLDAFVEAYEQDPCGWGGDFLATTAANSALSHTITVPVLLAYGDRDPVASVPEVELQRARYALASDDVSMQIIPDMGHEIMLERPAAAFRAGLGQWLKARGL
jgi:pimeloyl-ACP methyl ester carboxylesterase